MPHRPGNAVLSGQGAQVAWPARLPEQVRAQCRVKHYSLRVERVYVDWIKRFILANGKRHPRELGAAEAERFPTGLAAERDMATSTQNQALSALLFLHRGKHRTAPGAVAADNACLGLWPGLPYFPGAAGRI